MAGPFLNYPGIVGKFVRQPNHARLLRGIVGTLALALVCLHPAGAETQKALPDGIIIGRWFVSPYLFQGMERNGNVFRTCDDAELCDEPQKDWVRRTTVDVGARLPFRNSSLDLEYTGDRYDYRENDFGRNWTHDGRAHLLFRLSSGDQVSFSERYSSGFTDVRTIDEGGELTFLGVPYRLNRADVEVSRASPGQQGYSIRVARVDLNWEPGEDQSVPFFDYRGFDTRYEFRQPMTGNRWLVVYHDRRLFNQYRARSSVDWSLGVPFRKEDSGSYQVGLRGETGGGHTYYLSLGWGTFEYTGREASPGTFSGLVGQFQLSAWLGTRTEMTVEARRRALPSSFPTYYVLNEFRVSADRQWLQYSKAGFEAVYSQNDYADPIPGTSCTGDRRRDRRWEAEAFVDWLFHRYAGLRVSAKRAGRNSNCAGSDYDANVVFAGLTLGWF